MTSMDDSQSLASSSVNNDHQTKNVHEQSINHGEMKHDISEEEIRSILEVIAATGKFWHDWNILKGVLSYRLKQVLAEYPESQKKPDTVPELSSLSGETDPELIKRLDKALLSFEEGPPFTLQRLCEFSLRRLKNLREWILLTPKAIYTSLSKLALALEKNLLVTTTLSVCADPYPSTTAQGPVEPEKASEGVQANPVHTENGIETKVGLSDEEMVEADVEQVDKNIDMTTPGEENIPRTSEADSDSTGSGESPSLTASTVPNSGGSESPSTAAGPSPTSVAAEGPEG